MSTSEEMRRFEDISQNDITGEVKGITPRAPLGVPNFAKVNTWIDHGETRDTVHLTSKSDSEADEKLHEWIRQYSEGRQAFQDTHFESARRLTKEGHPTMAIIAARQVLEIPWRGSEFGGMLFGGRSTSEVDKALGLSKRQAGGGPRLAFSVPTKMKEELHGHIEKARETIGQAAPATTIAYWAEGLNGFELEGDLHSAGMAALEIVQAQNSTDLMREPSIFYANKAVGYLDQRTETVFAAHEVKDTAELDELGYHLRHAIATAVRFDSGADASNLIVDDKVLMRATYKIDDFRERREVVRDAYRYLARRAWRFRDSFFFNGEARGVEKQIRFDKILARQPHGPYLNPPLRKNRRHKRPFATP